MCQTHLLFTDQTPTSYASYITEHVKMRQKFNSLPEGSTAQIDFLSGNGQSEGTHERQNLIPQGQISPSKKQNNMSFEMLEHTVITLAKFFGIEESTKGVDRLMRLLYKIKSRIDSCWIDILNLQAIIIVYSVDKDFSLKYNQKS